jgi:peptidoglycan/xylan/chitin deacetylase (PgdA/CDA1 family)
MSRLALSRCAAAILIYHSIADVERDPFGITVGSADFEGQMDVLSRRFNVLALGELCAGLDRRELPERAVVVTFDDGYANNLAVALPSLAAHRVPATLFVATGYIGGDREFWWDEIERLIWVERGVNAAPELELSVGGESLHCPMEDRTAAVRRITLWLQGRPAGSVELGLGQLRQWAGADERLEPRDTHRPLTVAELRELASSPQIEIGAHTRTHPRLGAQGADVQRDEIQRSRSDLESWLGSAPAAFAYPFGSPGTDYSSTTVALVGEAGFAAAVSGSPHLAQPSSPRYELPRWFVTKAAPCEFERWLANRFRPRALRALSKTLARARGGGEHLDWARRAGRALLPRL